MNQSPHPISNLDGNIAADREFLDFINEQFDPLVKFLRARHVLKQDAEDIVQECFIRLSRYKGEPAKALRPLSYRIVLNLLSDSRRLSTASINVIQTAREDETHQIIDEMAAPDLYAYHRQELERTQRAILKLPSRCRQIYLLNRIDGMSYSQISLHAGVSVKAVEKQMSKALSLLRSELASELHDPN